MQARSPRQVAEKSDFRGSPAGAAENHIEVKAGMPVWQTIFSDKKRLPKQPFGGLTFVMQLKVFHFVLTRHGFGIIITQ